MASVLWKGVLSFGLVNVPVKLSAAARSENISFNQIHGVCGDRINQQIVCKTCDTTVNRDELLKGYEYEKGKFITFDKDEITDMAPDSSQVLEIVQTVATGSIDPILFENSYYLEPDKGGDDGYALLYTALEHNHKQAVGQITLTSREHTVVIRPYKNCLVMHTLFLEDEVRDAPNAHVNEVNPEYLKLAKQLLEGIEDDFDHSQYVDHYRENVQTLINAKVAGQVVPKKSKAAHKHMPNIADALLASIQANGGKTKKVDFSKKQKKGVSK